MFIQEHCKWASYVILERRANLGGTWDFFKYPGIRYGQQNCSVMFVTTVTTC